MHRLAGGALQSQLVCKQTSPALLPAEMSVALDKSRLLLAGDHVAKEETPRGMGTDL